MKIASFKNEEATPTCLSGITRKLDLLLVITLCGFVSSVVYYYWLGAYREKHWPYSSPLYDPKDHFSDFYNMVQLCRDLPKAVQSSNYPPAANLYFHFFGLLPRGVSIALFVIVPIWCLAWCAVRSMNGLAAVKKLIYAVGIFFISYPFLFAIDRGNLDLHLFVFIAIFLYSYQQSSSWAKGAAAFCLAVAISFKAYPVLFAVLYFKDRRYRELVLAGIFTVAITLLAAVPEGGIGKAVGGFLHGMRQTTAFDIGIVGRFNLGLFNAGRLVLNALKIPDILRWFTVAYTPLSFALLLLVCGLAAKRSLALWRSATALVSAMCFIPTLSFDYRLLLLVAPLCLFIGANTPMTRRNIIICVIFGLLLIPKGQIILYYHLGPLGPALVTPACFINPILLVSLTILVLFPSKNEEFDPVNPPPTGAFS
jgi:hypothetical protein